MLLEASGRSLRWCVTVRQLSGAGARGPGIQGMVIRGHGWRLEG